MAWLVAGSYMTKAPAITMYASVMSRETVRIALKIAALNNLEVKSGYILNKYIQAHVTGKVWTTLGPVYGEKAREATVIILVWPKMRRSSFQKPPC